MELKTQHLTLEFKQVRTLYKSCSSKILVLERSLGEWGGVCYNLLVYVKTIRSWGEGVKELTVEDSPPPPLCSPQDETLQVTIQVHLLYYLTLSAHAQYSVGLSFIHSDCNQLRCSRTPQMASSFASLMFRRYSLSFFIN